MKEKDFSYDMELISRVINYRIVIPNSNKRFIVEFWDGVRKLEYDSLFKLSLLEREVMLYKLGFLCFPPREIVDSFGQINTNFVTKIEREVTLKFKREFVFKVLKKMLVGTTRNNEIKEEELKVLERYFSDYFLEQYLSNTTNNKYTSLINLINSITGNRESLLSTRQKRLLYQYGMTINGLVERYISGEIKGGFLGIPEDILEELSKGRGNNIT